MCGGWGVGEDCGFGAWTSANAQLEVLNAGLSSHAEIVQIEHIYIGEVCSFLVFPVEVCSRNSLLLQIGINFVRVPVEEDIDL